MSKLLNSLGGSAETLLDQLPDPVRQGLTGATEQALRFAMHAAEGSRRAVPDQQPWVNTALTTAMGAAGGLGGMSTALMELPATTAMLLRSIQGAAAREGFDPSEDGVKFDCIQVLSAAGPMANDDGADLGFFSVRLTLTGPAMQRVIAAVAPALVRRAGPETCGAVRSGAGGDRRWRYELCLYTVLPADSACAFWPQTPGH